MSSASYEDDLDMRYEHGRARALSHMQVELGGVGTQAALRHLCCGFECSLVLSRVRTVDRKLVSELTPLVSYQHSR